MPELTATATRRLLIAAAVALTLPLAACGGTDDAPDRGASANADTDVSEAIAPAPAPEPEPEPLSNEDVFILSLDMEGVHYSSRPAAINAGRAICSDLADGSTFYELGLTVMSHGGYSAPDAGYIVGAAITAFCPRYQELIPS